MENSMDPAHLQILHQDTANRGRRFKTARADSRMTFRNSTFTGLYGLMKRRTYKTA